MKQRKAQEEMIGFALIMILVVVILLVFLGFALRNPQKDSVESYEVESFVQAFLQYTSDCKDNLEYLSIQKLIFACDHREKCLDERDSCEVLESNLKGVVEESWGIESRPIEGYELTINSNDEEVTNIKQGEITNNYKTGGQDFSKAGSLIEIVFTAYY